MSASVDVLAVMDRDAANANAWRVESGMFDDQLPELTKRRKQSTEARAAVAFLIAAARMANGDHVAPHDCYATGPLTGDPIEDLVVCPGCRLNAALARVQP